MTDMTGHHRSLLGTSSPRLRARRRAEWRLRAYGITAITVAGLALFTLLWSVLSQAATSITESYLTLPVTLSANELGLDDTATPNDILRADFSGLTKDVLKEQFPSIKGRTAKRELYDLVSSGASFELATKASLNPALIGQTIEYPFLASDATDLYLKGEYGALVESPTKGNLTITLDDDAVTVTSTADDFATALLTVKKHLLGDAADLRRKAARQDNAAQVYAQRAETADTDKEREKNSAKAKKSAANRDKLLAQARALEIRASQTEGTEELDDENRSMLINVAGGWIKLTKLDRARASGTVLTETRAVTDVADWSLYMTDLPEAARKISDTQIAAIETLRVQGQVDRVFNWRFFTSADSREPELAGIWGATVGSFWTMLVTFLLAFPIGVSAAVYLEEFAPRNKFTDFVEVNINNLAAVPSIVFGLLGLSVFLGIFGVPRSAPLAGGIVLALMTLPTIIIASRAALKAVPPSIRDAALGVGASRLQTTFHHVLPLAMPGVLTGTIIGMAQALGETAPLIMIGMVAFIVDIPGGITDSASVLPVQVFRWSDFPERAFEAKTGAAICVLLLFLVVMNAVAILLRRRFERRW
ncbi:Phosphate transport system permease protein PstC [Roseovarius litorisediminis]|uniref:Phosphate transport system permease protein PstA n=1 Tax=Roseovarius litorisediminis TaxID=1312363 RepID=A0A1Y5R9N5_9RHOB|nr:phosphate ABC transporter permease PstA [Roseovarius litorisediminis]SLN12362.1 Phosphate transport system permease protein PstC [Roseovarius litorisediminis]